MKNVTNKTAEQSMNLVDLLVDVDFSVPSANVDSLAVTTTNIFAGFSTKFQRITAQYVNDEYFRILSPMNTGGLSVEGRYSRGPSVVNRFMVLIEILFWYRNPKISEADIILKVNFLDLNKNLKFCFKIECS